MAFPDSRLLILPEMAFGADLTADPSTWLFTDLSDRLVEKPIPVRRGKPAGATSLTAGGCTVHFHNPDAALTPLHPTSPYWPNVTLGTPFRLRVKRIVDTFTRTVSNSWSTADTGQTWTNSGGSANDYDVAGGVGTHTLPATNASHRSTTGSLRDCEVMLSFATDTLASGAAMSAAVMLRHADASNFYMARVTVETDQSVTAALLKLVGGSQTSLDSATVAGLTHAAGTFISVRAHVQGSTLRMRVWETGDPEPTAWDCEATDTSLPSAGGVGVRTIRNTGNTSGSTVVSIDNLATYVDRFTGYADQFEPILVPTTDKPTEMISLMRITASGVTRRASQGTPPVRSPLRRAIGSPEHTPIRLAYWPGEDEADATQAASAVPGVPAMVATGTVDFAGHDPNDSPGGTLRRGTLPLPLLSGGGSLTGTAPAGTSSPVAWSVQVYGGVESVPGSDLVLFEWTTPGGSHTKWQLVLVASTLFTEVRAITSAGATVVVLDDNGINTGVVEYAIDAVQDGADIDVRLWIGNVLFDSQTVSSATLARPAVITLHPAATVLGFDFAAGHTRIWDDQDAPRFGNTATDIYSDAIFGVSLGSRGEPAHERLARLCTEDGIPVVVTAIDEVDASRMDSQPDGTPLDLYRQSETADGGLLYEVNFGLGYLPRVARYNLTPTLTVDLSTYRTAEGTSENVVKPVYNDQRRRNRVRVSRPGGSSAVAEDPDLRAGTYETVVTALLRDDSQLQDHADWRLHVASVDEQHYPTFPIDLGANPDLIDAWLSTELADRIVRTNVPEQHPPGDIDQVLAFYTETLSPLGWVVVANGEPYSPWQVAVVEGDGTPAAPPWRLKTGGSHVAAAVDADDTSLLLVTSLGPRWSTTAEFPADFPFDVDVGGEQVTVDSLADSLAFVAAGTPTHADNANVTPGLPAGRAVGDLLLTVAAIRNSGTGVPDTPTGTVRLPVFGVSDNVQLFARIATNTAADQPTVSFTGGVAGATTTAIMLAVRSTEQDLDGLVAAVSAVQLNGSAQDIAYPALAMSLHGCFVLIIAWKQDDWTSVDPATGFTEAAEPDTTTGNDQGLVLDYVVQTLKSSIPAGSLVVTGGGAAISRSVVVALHGAQTATVTRGVNGVTKSHGAGAAVQLWRPPVIAQ